MLNAGNTYRFMFEPFHSRKVARLSNWHHRQYLRHDDPGDEFIAAARSILSGQIRHRWIDRFNGRLLSWKRLIKDIRANLFLGWIKHQFPEVPIILILRHPCAVACSKMSLGWEVHIDSFLAQDQLLHDFLDPFKKQIQTSNDMFDRHITMWCIQNYIPLCQFNKGEIAITFYENLCNDPVKEVGRILALLGENSLPNQLTPSKPSALSRKDSAIVSGMNPVESWKSQISDRQLNRAIEICSIFGLQIIYGESTQPLLKGDEALAAFSV